MRLRLLQPPSVTVTLDRAYRIEPLWMEAAQSGYIAAYFSGPDHWRLSDGYNTPAALARAWSEGWDTGPAPWPTAIARALIRAGLAEEVVKPAPGLPLTPS